jgi:hypothetical protein
MRKPIGDGSALQRQYSPDDLRTIWGFSQQDFDRFLEILLWLESLPGKREK